jgi:hypothetical protein
MREAVERAVESGWLAGQKGKTGPPLARTAATSTLLQLGLVAGSIPTVRSVSASCAVTLSLATTLSYAQNLMRSTSTLQFPRSSPPHPIKVLRETNREAIGAS